MRPVNNVRNLFMHKVIFTIITKPSWRKLFSCNNWGYISLWNMHVLPKAFSPTVPCHWSLWKLLKVSAMTVSERLASALTLSYTLKYLNAISAKKSFLSNVTLFNTLANNNACDVCEKKFIKASYSMWHFKTKWSEQGMEVSETDTKLTKICHKSSNLA